MIAIDTHTSIPTLQKLLEDNNWLNPNEKISALSKPGEGNMNVVLRAETNQRSFILKQSRPFVQKYQQIEAPLNRIEVEYKFYKAIHDASITSHIPSILGFDPKNYLLQMEDLGQCEDMTFCYRDRSIAQEILEKLINIAAAIHKVGPLNDFPENMALRKLNHQHIFVLPFLEDNGFQLNDVQEGLQELSLPYKRDNTIKAVVNKLGDMYLSKGNVLIHGDYYPGSWMQLEDEVYIIDPEFGFIGFREFDLGVMTAHLILATMDPSSLKKVMQLYKSDANAGLVSQVAGVEIIRRLIGLAQLPLKRSLSEKEDLLKLARKMILV
ncbi:phosphotransferase [Eudoraea adriatica]|uniref:phosphotransferase n=1 Tax=Eudoraea adriatica TaxID=446681 RepID=UPI0003731CCE|nr:phosphotransferase [Eudoraea adriatica]